MPLYQYSCECGAEFEQFFTLRENSQVCQCVKCDRMAGKVLTPARLNVDYPGYSCPVTGKWVEGRKAHRENLARTGCRILEPGEHETNMRRKREAEEALDREIGESVEAQIEAMSSRQVEKLGEELQSGTDLSYARR